MATDSERSSPLTWAHLRFSIVGPLLSAPPARGELKAAMEALAQKTWRHPGTGEPVTFTVKTIERWYYKARNARQDPVGALRKAIRKDAGRQAALSPAFVERLLETARRLRPRMLLLDPLVRLHAVDENSATQVAQLLAGLRELQRGLDLAIILVHHTRKAIPAGMAAGQGLRGSTDLHAFGDSNLYLRRLRGQLVLTMEHRAAAAPEPVGLELVTTEEQTIHLAVTSPASSAEARHETDLDQAVLDVLERRPVMSRHALRKDLAVQNERLGRTLVRLEGQGRIRRGPDGWRLSDHSPVPCSPP